MIKVNYTAQKKLLLNFQNSQMKKRGETLLEECIHGCIQQIESGLESSTWNILYTPFSYQKNDMQVTIFLFGLDNSKGLYPYVLAGFE